MKIKVLAALAAVCVSAAASAVNTSPQTATFDVKLTIVADCVVASNGDMDFNSTGYITAPIDTSTTFKFGCTKGTTPNVKLTSANTGCPGGAARCMKNGASAYVNYELYTDSSGGTVWPAAGQTPSVAGDGTVASGAGSANKTVTVYGRVPVQTTDTPGNYSDTVTVSVYF